MSSCPRFLSLLSTRPFPSPTRSKPLTVCGSVCGSGSWEWYYLSILTSIFWINDDAYFCIFIGICLSLRLATAFSRCTCCCFVIILHRVSISCSIINSEQLYVCVSHRSPLSSSIHIMEIQFLLDQEEANIGWGRCLIARDWCYLLEIDLDLWWAKSQHDFNAYGEARFESWIKVDERTRVQVSFEQAS